MALVMCGCGAKKDDGSLSTEWQDMQFMLNDVRYDLPCDLMVFNNIIEIDISENMQMSFASIENATRLVDANSTTTVIGCFKDSDVVVTLTIVNIDDTAKELKECQLGGISVQAGLLYDKTNSEWSTNAPDIVVAGGGKFGMTMDEIITTYGEPAINETFENKYGTTGNIYYTVTDKDNVTKYLRFSFYKNILNEIELMCEEYVKQ